MESERLTIAHWSEDDQPREKLRDKGPQALSDAELLAILIGSGTPGVSAVDLMQQILRDCHNNLNTLGKIDISKLPPQRIDQINALTRSQFPLAGKLKRLEKAIKKIEAELEKMRAGKIRVSDVIYPGTNVMINSVAKNVQSEIKHCTLSVKDDNVDIGPY